jgi:chemotaxis protein methyltransferase CheR
MSQALAQTTEYPFTEEDFQWLRHAASSHSGIMLADVKRNMIYSRLAKRLRHLKLKSFSEYRRLLTEGDAEEFSEFINAITTNLTSFFREPHHFEHLRRHALPATLARKGRRDPFRVWSSGCSTGEEPYSIAITLDQEIGDKPDPGCEILATDLDTRVLKHAEEGVYSSERVESLSVPLLRRYFQKGVGPNAGKVRVRDWLRRHVQFEQLNLTRSWNLARRFDVIFCRNVVIYFDKPTQIKLFSSYAAALNEGGFLYIGHAESLHQVSDRFKLVDKTTYQRID